MAGIVAIVNFRWTLFLVLCQIFVSTLRGDHELYKLIRFGMQIIKNVNFGVSKIMFTL